MDRARSSSAPAACTTAAAIALSVASALAAPPARAQMPSAQELLDQLGLPASDAQQAKAGEFVSFALEPSHERELTAGFVFLVKGVTPTELVGMLRQGEFDRLDPDTLAVQILQGEPRPEDFAKLTLHPDPAQQAKKFLAAKPGEGLNLSTEELAAFQELGSGASTAQVEARIRSLLLARMVAYRQRGLAGIAPYARGGGETRSPAEDLRSASQAQKVLPKVAPAAHRLLLGYPEGKPAGTEEVFRWSQISAHGEPTLVLTHSFYVPDGDAWVAVQRQFYVSTGYNCEQAVAGLVPVQGGTAVFYANRTSTDQVTGFGGGAKRSLGSRILAQQLEELFAKVRAKAGAAGG